MAQLDGFEAVCITGGEPAAWPSALVHLALMIKSRVPAKLFLYTSVWSRSHYNLPGMFDGITYAIHNADYTSEKAFEQFQFDIGMFPGKTHRLFIPQGLCLDLRLHVSKWSRVEVKPYSDNCPLPAGETLFILDEGIWERCKVNG